jgi:hypothetical protein
MTMLKTLSIMTFRITTLSKEDLFVTFNINKHRAKPHSVCCVLFIVILNVIKMSFVILNVIFLM